MTPVAWTGRDSGWWLVAAGAAFTAAELLFVPPRMGLSWDEVVYVSQVSGHAPAAWFFIWCGRPCLWWLSES